MTGFLGRAALAALAALAGALTTTGCAVTRTAADPTVVVQTRGGAELGVSTPWGIVFLGRSARMGTADVVLWYGDGPSIEPTLVEPVGGGLYVLETEIRPPVVPLTFAAPAAGAPVEIVGRGIDGRWRASSRVVKDERVDGLLLEVPPELAAASDQVGAGVFLEDRRGRPQLLGLVSGRVVLERNGTAVSYLTAVGPAQLWRLVAYRRDDALRRGWVYRDDIL